MRWRVRIITRFMLLRQSVNCGRLRSLQVSKLHKPCVDPHTPSLCPIVPSIGAFEYNLSKYLSSILTPLMPKKYNVSTSLLFVQENLICYKPLRSDVLLCLCITSICSYMLFFNVWLLTPFLFWILYLSICLFLQYTPLYFFQFDCC